MSEIENIIIPLIGGLACIFTGFKFREKNKILMQNVVEVEGIIFSYEGEAGFDDDADYRRDYPITRFVTREGIWITEKADSAISLSFLKEGKPVKVFYNPDNPKESSYHTLPAISIPGMDYLATIIGGLVLLYGAWNAFKFVTQQS